MKAIDVWLAQAGFVLTANLARAASLRLLPKAERLPARKGGEGKSAHLEIVESGSGWDRSLAEGRHCGLLPLGNQPPAEV
jgi:hypothetical protein